MEGRSSRSPSSPRLGDPAAGTGVSRRKGGELGDIWGPRHISGFRSGRSRCPGSSLKSPQPPLCSHPYQTPHTHPPRWHGEPAILEFGKLFQIPLPFVISLFCKKKFSQTSWEACDCMTLRFPGSETQCLKGSRSWRPHSAAEGTGRSAAPAGQAERPRVQPGPCGRI